MRTHPRLPLLLLVLLSAVSAPGDGIPVAADKKGLAVERVTIALTPEQTAQVESRRSLHFTEGQRAQLRARFSALPESIPVVSSRYNSCTCDLPLYGVWCRVGQVEIPVDCLRDFRASAGENHEDEEVEEAADSATDNFECLTIILDAQGRYHRVGTVTSLADLETHIEAMYQRRKLNEKLRCSVFLDTPPPLDEAGDAAIRRAVEQVAARCQLKHIPIWAPGFNEE